MLKNWSLKDIILLALIAIFCGVISWSASFLYNGLLLILTPLGLSPFANEITLGLWIISGPLAACLFKRPGAAFISEVLTALVEMLCGDEWGIINIITGAIQGAGTEAGFALTCYRHYDKIGLCTAALTGTIITFSYDLFNLGYFHYSLRLLLSLFITRLLSLLILSSWLPAIIIKLLKRSHAIE